MQCNPGAIVNKPTAEYKIAKIVCLSALVETLYQESYSNLHKMVTETLEHVETRFTDLCNRLTAELERQSYEQLASMEELTYASRS